MAQESECIRATDGPFYAVQHRQRAFKGGQQFVRTLVVHGAAQTVMRAQPRAEHGVEERIGPLVAQEERFGFVARAADQAEKPVVDVASKRVVGDDCRHAMTLRSLP